MLHPNVQAALDAASIPFEEIPCRVEWADTAEFCANYKIKAEEACNAIVVALKTTPRTYVACLVRSDTRLDVNHRVAKEVGFKRLSFFLMRWGGRVASRTETEASMDLFGPPTSM